MDAETLYLKLTDFIRSETDFDVTDEADEMLADAARLITAGESESDTVRAADPNSRYAMYTTAGNAAVAAKTAALVAKIGGEEFPRRDLNLHVESLLSRVGASHGEVYDTEPRAQVRHEVNLACDAVGWKGWDG